MYIENIRNIGYIKEDSSASLLLKVLDYDNQPFDLKSNDVVKVEILVGINEGRLFTKEPILHDEPGVLEFELDKNDNLILGANLVEIHIHMVDGAKYIAPSRGYFKLMVERNIDSLGEADVTKVTLDFFLDQVDERIAQIQGEIDLLHDTREYFETHLDETVDLAVDNKMTPFVEVVNDRLDKTTKEVIKVDEKTNRELISKRNRKPMITIIDDDGRNTVLTNWEPILKEKDFKLDIAVITGFVGNSMYLPWEELERLKRTYNVDLINHTHTHPHLGQLETEAEVREQIQKSTDILKSRGHSYDIMVYPYGSHNSLVRQVAREYCRAGVDTFGGVNTPPLETFRLSRQALIPSSGSMDSLESYTQYIDEAIENNGWIIFMSHSQYEGFDAEKIKAIIDYANSNGVEWVHTKEGLDRIGNLIDIGDYVSRALNVGYTILDADGQFHSNNYNFVRALVINSVTLDTSISELPEGLSYTMFYGSSHGFPTSSGVVFSYAYHPFPIYSWQMIISTTANEVYRRQGNSDGTWGKFTTVHNNYFVERGYNKYSADTPITAYPANSVTTFIVNTSGGAGFPNGSAGVVTTYRMHSDNWSRQEFRKYRSNELWARYIGSDGNWTEWEKISAI